MTHPLRARYGCEERIAKSRVTAPPVSSLKHPSGGPQTWPIHPRPTGNICRSHFPSPPQVSLFHTRHAEESAERPHLVTIVRPCGQTSLRKVTVLLNRRGVVSFDQLLLDISEALGFPRWHRARVTRLYTTHAREVKGVCDFFRGEMAFLALGKARPELSNVQEALEELFPEYSHYRADALRAWEKKLRPTPDKAAKADSGYSEGADNSETNQEKHEDKLTRVKKHTNTQTHHLVDAQHLENYNPDVWKPQKQKPCRKPIHLPNHLQRLHVRGTVGVRQPSIIDPIKHEDDFREDDTHSPTLCENCLARQARQQDAGWMTPLSGRVPLPPVLRKQKESSPSEEMRKLDVALNPPPPLTVSTDKEKSIAQLQLLNPNVVPVMKHIEQRTTLELPSDGNDISLSDIDQRYEIGRVVGDGNFAVVRECRRRDGKQTFAMKIVERSKLIGREHMMQNELSLLSSLCHPHIVRLFAHHHTKTHFYLLMELVSGGDLFEAISERGKFSEAEAGLMVSDVSDALNYIHCKSIVHRDVKPENLLLERVAAGVSRLKLGDFGLAMVVTEPVFTICGTPTYVAPEILCEAGYGVAVDVWALGVILYILLCGFPPFRSRDRNQEELFELIRQGQLHFLSPYWDPISEEARGLVRALLQTDPTMRLTAEQTLLHPWVKAMASMCRQRALTDKTQTSTADTEAELGKVETQAQTHAAETNENKIQNKNTNSWGEITLKEPRGAEKVTGRRHDEDKLPQEQSTHKSTVHSVSPQIKELTLSEATPGQKEPLCNSTDSGLPSRQEIQQHTDPRSVSADLSQLDTTAQKSQQQSPMDSLSSTTTAPQTTADHSTQHHPTSPARLHLSAAQSNHARLG